MPRFYFVSFLEFAQQIIGKSSLDRLTRLGVAMHRMLQLHGRRRRSQVIAGAIRPACTEPKFRFGEGRAMTVYAKLILMLITMCLIAQPAHAILITNLDDVPHTVKINNAGEVREVLIQPNGVYRTFGRGNMISMQVEGFDPVRGENMNEYVIWDDGRLKLQRRRHSINKRLD